MNFNKIKIEIVVKINLKQHSTRDIGLSNKKIDCITVKSFVLVPFVEPLQNWRNFDH